MYDDCLDDPKVQRLPPDLFKIWINLLCLASRNGGNLPCMEDIAFALRIDEAAADQAIGVLIDRGLLDDGDIVRPHNWDSRQFKSDADATSSDRQRKKRERDKQQVVTRDETDDVTRDKSVTSRPPETETETETEEEEKRVPLSRRDANAMVAEAMEAWNQLATDLSLPTITKFSANRRSKLAARLRDCGGIDGWRSALAKIRGSPFCRGDNDRGWKADFDFLLQEQSFIRLMEGRYDDRGSTKQPKSSRSENFKILDAIVAEAYRREAAESGADGQGDPVIEAGLRQRTG